MDDTLDLIHTLANERHFLYRIAGKQHLTESQLRRLNEIDGQLPILWDRHRREVASRRHIHKAVAFKQAA